MVKNTRSVGFFFMCNYFTTFIPKLGIFFCAQPVCVFDGPYLTELVLIDNFHLPEAALWDSSGKKDNCGQKVGKFGNLQDTAFWVKEYLAFHRSLWSFPINRWEQEAAVTDNLYSVQLPQFQRKKGENKKCNFYRSLRVKKILLKFLREWPSVGPNIFHLSNKMSNPAQSAALFGLISHPSF